jgi:hypothetical protein
MSVDPNMAAARTGTVAIAGQTFTVSQTAGELQLCGFSRVAIAGRRRGERRRRRSWPADGAEWTAASNDSWLTVTGGHPERQRHGHDRGERQQRGDPERHRDDCRSDDHDRAGRGAAAGWSHQDIGAVGVAGNASFDAPSSTYSVTGGGADVWGLPMRCTIAIRR